MPMNGNFANNPFIMMMLEQMRRAREQAGEVNGFGPPSAPQGELGGMAPEMGQRMGLGGMPRVSGGGNGMGMGFAGGKPDMGGDPWGPPSMSMGQRDAPMPMPKPFSGGPAMGQIASPNIMRLLGAMQGMKRPKGRGGW